MRIGDFHAELSADEALFDTRAQRTWFALRIAAARRVSARRRRRTCVYLACLLGIHLISAAGLNVMTGYTGLISLGHAAFMGVGVLHRRARARKRGIPFWLALPAAGFVAAATGLVFAIPSLRMKGLYLAIATLAAQFMLALHLPRVEVGDRRRARGRMSAAASVLGFELEQRRPASTI